jgi:hypothetical protein
MAGKVVYEKFWDEKFNYGDGEKQFYEGLAKVSNPSYIPRARVDIMYGDSSICLIMDFWWFVE